MPKALTWNLFVQKARAVHGDKYTYPDQAYTNVNTPVLIVCERHSGFRQCPNDHLYNKAGCPECFSEKRQQVAERRRLTSAAYEQRANIKHGGRYAYPNLRYELGNKHITKCTITVRCPDHGEFTQNAANHLYASGCEDCGRLKTTASITEPREEVWKRIKAAHGDRYTYLNWDEYRTTHFRLKIKCSNPSHPPFFQTVIEHIQGRGCRLCGYTKRDQTTQRKHFATFLDRANKAHPDAHYRYPQLTTEFVNNRSWITVVCPRHNTFRQQVSTHLSGRGCLDCAAIARSAAQRKTVKYLLDSAIKAHRDKGYWYPYVDEEYRNRNSVVTVGCPNCQLFFQQKISVHINLRCGCPRCGRAKLKHPERPGMLYLCRFKSENEEFVKVGTTIKSVKDRFAGGKSTGFSYRSLLVFSGSIGQARDIERQVLISFSEIQIVPVSFRYGRTECFDCVAQESIVALIQKLCIDKGMVLQPVDFTESEQLVGSTSTALLDTKAEASNAGEQLAEE